jgi:hypothetical protein
MGFSLSGPLCTRPSERFLNDLLYFIGGDVFIVLLYRLER